jgi:3',5'-cyclic-AMP phosphodiesterase
MINRKTMKKILLAILLTIFLFLGGFFFLKAKNSKILPSQADLGNSTDPIALSSFQGVIDWAFERPAVQTNNDNAATGRSPFGETNQKKTGNFPPAESSSAFTFAILGDTQRFEVGNPNGNFQKAAANMKKLNPDLVFAMGDLVGSCDGDSKCSKEYGDWKNIVGTFLPKTYATQGNHDRTGDDKTDNTWRTSFNFPTNGPAGFSEQVYSFDLKNSHFVVLDSDKPKEHLVNGEERAWLEQDLVKNKKENTFVFFHEPAYPASSKITESLDKEPGERDALWQILKKYNVTAVFNGHEHIVSRRKIGSIYQFVFGNTDSFNHDLPAAGVAEYSNQGQGRFGFVKVNGKEITVETHDPSNAILDSFTFSK